MSELVKVPQNIITASYENFVKVFYPEDRRSAPGRGLHFWAFLGLHCAPGSGLTHKGWPMPKDAAHCATMLASPHYRAVAMAMLAKGHQYKRPADHS